MKHSLLIAYAFLHISLLYPWGSSNTSASDMKQPIDFSGTISTHQDQIYKVNNISVDGKCKKIILYDAPNDHSQPMMNVDTKQLEIKLSDNPTADFSRNEVNLEDVTEISVPSPHIIWVYQKKEHAQKQEYLEVEIVENKKKKFCLLERKAAINCNDIETDKPQKKIVPLSALKKLTIEGFACRIASKESPTCPIEKK